MAEFYGHKPEVVKIGERIKMLVLKEHNKYEKPPHGKELLMLIDTGEEYLWKVGIYDGDEFWSDYDYQGLEYEVLEWYELPSRVRVDKNYSYKQMQLEDFWNNR